MEPLLIANDLDSDQNPCLVIDAAHNLAEASLSKNVDNLIPVRKVVSWYDGVIAALIVISEIGPVRVEISDNLGRILSSAKVDVVVVNNLATLIDVEHGDTNSVWRADAFLGSGALPQCIKCPCC